MFDKEEADLCIRVRAGVGAGVYVPTASTALPNVNSHAAVHVRCWLLLPVYVRITDVPPL